MGIVLSDLSRKIKDEHMDYLHLMLTLIEKHTGKASECATDIAELDQTISMLDYSKRTRAKMGCPSTDATSHMLLIAEEETQRKIAYQQMLQHTATAKIFEDDLKDFLVTTYRVHRNNVNEWHIDLGNALIFRKLKIGQEKQEKDIPIHEEE